VTVRNFAGLNGFTETGKNLGTDVQTRHANRSSRSDFLVDIFLAEDSAAGRTGRICRSQNW
jgi:hypothetical protein